MELHVSRKARERCRFDERLFAWTGKAVLPDFRSARTLADALNRARDAARFPERRAMAGQLNAMGLINEVLHYMIGLYRRVRSPEALGKAVVWTQEKLGRSVSDASLAAYARAFPPLPVDAGEMPPERFIEGETSGAPHRQVLLEEMLVLWLANANPAYSPYLDLFDDADLEAGSGYTGLVSETRQFFDTQPPFGPDEQNLVDMLRSPALAAPHSLSGQLEYIWRKWGYLLAGTHLHRMLLQSLDFIKEEEKLPFLGPGPSRVYDFAGLEFEPERYSADSDWMPRLVLIAKHTYVWLDQLSRKYGRPITTVDQIPGEELDLLARRGFTGLWLIGLWERSAASRRIKQMRGNPEAVASAYSLFDYEIAGDLGGGGALSTLRDRAWERGIRLASDMVPNHMGIDSRWVIEHPDWFLSLDHSPFPAYSFNGPDLSWEGRVGIFLEDHYYDSSDAAVVFKRRDHWTGSERYIYHGNDGTSMPWNDTAQINYLNPEAREAVIQSILGVARKFPIIRFDAAMTLAKKHYQRLWFPEPGTGGSIPSRAEHGLTRRELDASMPEEFWRQVVDRVASEAPGTLLLAEAFWLMEGYFVRTLGMHRVYNSAFMNMLRDEENSRYRSVIKNTLEFDPEVLKRYVNFMNNPDEKTALDQFGKGDKYFGICTLMATLPGLPMFGHAQIEGFAEKYGMEYRRAYYDERPEDWFVERHEREIFPLLRRRHIFAGVQDFLLYDLFSPDGTVNEDVFAFSNRHGEDRALVVCNNRYASARGWIRLSAAYAVKAGPGGERALHRRRLGEGLGLNDDGESYALFRDHISGLQFIRNSRDLFEKGLYVELNAYDRQVYLDFQQVRDGESRRHARLAAELNGRGVPSLEEAWRDLLLRTVQQPLREALNAETLRRLMEAAAAPGGLADPAPLDDVEGAILRFLHELARFRTESGLRAPEAARAPEPLMARDARRWMEAVLSLPFLAPRVPSPWPAGESEAEWAPASRLPEEPATWAALLAWAFLHNLGRIVSGEGFERHGRALIEEFGLDGIVAEAIRGLGVDEPTAWRGAALVKILEAHQRWFERTTSGEVPAAGFLRSLLADEDVPRFLHVNRHEEILWFNKEAFEQLISNLLLAAWAAIIAGDLAATAPGTPERIAACAAVAARCLAAAGKSSYKLELLLRILDAEEDPGPPASPPLP